MKPKFYDEITDILRMDLMNGDLMTGQYIRQIWPDPELKNQWRVPARDLFND